MAFNSWQFLVFFVVVFAVYFLLPKKVRHYFLLAASYFFYGFWNWRLIFLMLATTLVSYLSGFFIEKYRERKALRIALLVLTLLVSLGALFFFKYFNFIADSVVSLVNAFGGKATFNPLDIILPVGISFYTFQTLSYVIDVFEGKTPAEKNPVYYALYVSFFPQLVAGPIERPENLIPQFKEKQGIQRDNLVAGMKFMLQGFAKKILVADVIATFVNAVYNHLEGTNGFLVALGTIGFALQIYGDFSGYSDIAVGAAKMFNINLSKNFDRPYRATSIKDFLASVAHHPLDMVQGLPLFPHGRLPRALVALGHQRDGRLLPFGALARGGIDLHHLWPDARRLSDHWTGHIAFA